jgi:hypothetical protein
MFPKPGDIRQASVGFRKAMNIRSDASKFDVVRRWVANLLLLAFALRALVPVGYMPDFEAAARGSYKIVICTTAGAQSIVIDEDGNKVPQKHGDHNDQPCAFAGMAAFVDVQFKIAPLAVPVTFADLFAFRESVVLPPTRAGPVLGSRAPPATA